MAFDDFVRANAANLGANWTNSAGSVNSFEIHSNQAMNTGTNVCLEAYTASAAPDDQSSQVTLTILLSTTDSGPGPAVRISTSALTGYFAQANTTEIKLYKVVAGAFTQLGSNAAAAAVNDVLYIEAVGTAITVKKNGSIIIGPITDSAIATGNWGMWVSNGAGAETNAMAPWTGAATSSNVTVAMSGSASTGSAGTAVPGISVGL